MLLLSVRRSVGNDIKFWKTADWIENPFWTVSRAGPRNDELDRGPDDSGEWVNFGGNVVTHLMYR